MVNITNSKSNEEAESKQKQWRAVDVSGDGSKVWCYKEKYSVGTWNIRAMNQGKLEVVKQGMARINIDILEINELKWTRMGEFNSDDLYIYYFGQESLRRNAVALIVNKDSKMQHLGTISKMTEWSWLISKANYSLSQ